MEQPHSTMYLDHTDQQLEDYIDAMIDLVDIDFSLKAIADNADATAAASQMSKQLTAAFEQDALYGMGFESLEEEQFMFSLITAEYRHCLVGAMSAEQQSALSAKCDAVFAELATVLASEMLG